MEESKCERTRSEELLGLVCWESRELEREVEVLARWREIEGWDRRRTSAVDWRLRVWRVRDRGKVKGEGRKRARGRTSNGRWGW